MQLKLFSVRIQLEKIVLITRIFFFILSPLSFLGLLGIPAKKKKKTQEKIPFNVGISSLYRI